MDCVLQACERLLTQTETKRTHGAVHLPVKVLFIEKDEDVGKLVGVTSPRKIERLFVVRNPVVWQRST